MLWKKKKEDTHYIIELKKKIDTSSISTSGKKSFSVEKKNQSDTINHPIKVL